MSSNTSSRGVDALADLERLYSSDFGEFLKRLQGYLRHHDLEIVQAVVASKFARSASDNLFIANALVDLLGSNNSIIAPEAAKTIWEGSEGVQISDKVKSLRFDIESLRTEYETPYKMSSDGALRGLKHLRAVLPSDEAKQQFDELVAEIWE